MIRDKIEKIIELRKTRTLREIASILGCSAERIRQLLKNPHPPIPKEYKCSFCELSIFSIRFRKLCDKHIHQLEGRDFLRESVRMRDDYICQLCGKVWVHGTRRFDVHHTNEKIEGNKGRKYRHNKNISNMITLCHKCHLNLPEVKKKMTKKRLKKIG